MKRWTLTSLMLGVLELGVAETTLARGRGGRGHHGHHHFHGRVIVGVGPAFWWEPYPYWYYPYPYYAPPYVYAPPVVEAEPVYIERSTPGAPQAEESFWYFCRGANAYYPTVPSCPEAWIKVAPRP